jgi:hypothetical protein
MHICFSPNTGCLDGLRKLLKSSVKIVGVLAEIRTKHPRNTSHMCYCFSQHVQSLSQVCVEPSSLVIALMDLY